MTALTVEYIDPTTGQPVFKTITFLAQMLRPGERTLPVRQTANLLVAPFEGSGHSIVDGQRFDWKAVRHARRPGRLLVRARQRLRQGSGLPVHRQRRADAEEARPLQEMGPHQRRRGSPAWADVIRGPARRGPQPAAVSLCDDEGEFVLSRSNTTLVSHFDCPGGGQVWVEGTTMYVGHQRPTSGTTIVDVADPANPRHACAASTCRRAGIRTRCASATAS